MTNNEKIKEAERLIAEATKLIAEVKNSKDDENILADYINAFTVQDRMYYIDGDDDVDYEFQCSFDATESAPYRYYPTLKLAEQAKAMKDFNDRLLAFKYCYDADYKPDWSDTSCEKYYVYYSNRYHKYDVDSVTVCDLHNIYFSTEEIAQKCAVWLNSLKED